MTELLTLPIEIIQYISRFLDFFIIVNVSSLNKTCRKIFDNLFYREYAYTKYGKEFWKFAEKRSKHVSLPLGNFYEELRRLETYQRHRIKCGEERADNGYFYRLWVLMEPSMKCHVPLSYI